MNKLHAYILSLLLLSSCSNNKVDNAKATGNDNTSIENNEAVKPEPATIYKLSDEIFDGYKFGMSLNDAQQAGKKNNDKLKTNNNTLVGSHIIVCEADRQPAFKVKGNLTLYFNKENKLSGLMWSAKEKGNVMDMSGKALNNTNTINSKDMTVVYVCKMLAKSINKFQSTPFKIGEDADGFDSPYWNDGTRKISIYQNDYNIKVDRGYNIRAKDESIY